MAAFFSKDRSQYTCIDWIILFYFWFYFVFN